MKPRIAAHFGPLFRFQDATLEGRPNVTGAHVILPARLEPMTRSGEIYVTKDFKDSARTSYQVKKKYVFDSLGMMRLAKDFGEDKVFRLRKRTDPKEIIDPIMALDLTNTLPRPKGPDDDEKKLLDSLGATRNPQAFQALVQVSPLIKDMSNRSGPFLFALATLLKSGGMYQKAIDALDLLENQVLKAEDLEIRPYQYDLKVLALKTDCLSRLRRYQEAANLIYGVFKANENDSNTLSMLAAQYKRHGLYATSDTTPSMRDRTLIDRALNLYKEAFRRDITAYYPAINAAYLGIMLGGKQSDEGRKLAAFVCKYWQEGWDIDAWRRAATERGEKPDWWLPVSVAEAQMLLEGDSLEALVSHFAKLVNELKPTWFEKASTREQIEIYGIVTGRIGQVQPILDILDPNG
ncbi:tetratricopeptide repeat-containing protein [Candidatus Magnetaquiglobus chichijimensis]